MFKPLNFYNKFKEGSQIWCVFYEPQRSLFKTINWETHFLIKKINDSAPLSQALLLDTSSFFPNRCILCLPLFLFDKIYDFWRQLAKPSFRVFLPLNFNDQSLFAQWPGGEKFQSLSYYKEKLK